MFCPWTITLFYKYYALSICYLLSCCNIKQQKGFSFLIHSGLRKFVDGNERKSSGKARGKYISIMLFMLHSFISWFCVYFVATTSKQI